MMTRIDQTKAKELYDVGGDVYVSESGLPEDMQESHAVKLNINEHGGESFSSLMNDWYMFNHWGNKKPQPVFFTRAK